MPVHVFWDNSNIYGRAQGTRELTEPEVPWMALRVHWRNLYTLVARGRDVVTRCLAGSVPPECEDLWAYARDLGFDITLLRRVDSAGGGTKEQGVDEILQLKMANAVLDHRPPQTMILLSGDGRISEFGSSFPDQLERALSSGWNVEVYAWEAGFNHRVYDPLAQRFADLMRITLLDPHYESVTFVRGGDYYRTDAAGNKVYFHVPDRIVRPLPGLPAP